MKKIIKKSIILVVKTITMNKVRGNMIYSLRWWWTPWTYRFGHGGWILLRFSWLWRFWHGACGRTGLVSSKPHNPDSYTDCEHCGLIHDPKITRC